MSDRSVVFAATVKAVRARRRAKKEAGAEKGPVAPCKLGKAARELVSAVTELRDLLLANRLAYLAPRSHYLKSRLANYYQVSLEIQPTSFPETSPFAD